MPVVIPSKRIIMPLTDWLKYDKESTGTVVIGTAAVPLIRVGTKNLIEAGEKSFKTTFMLRLALGLATGTTVYPELPIVAPRRVLYLHGELSPYELKERSAAAAVGLPAPASFADKLDSYFEQGRDLEAELVSDRGRAILEDLVATYKPDDLILDPFQSFIPGMKENAFEDVSRVTHFCDELIAEHGVTLYIPIHTGKIRKRGARGHSSIAGWRDTRIQLSRASENSPIVNVTVDPRWAAAPPTFKLKFRDGTLWSDTPAYTPQIELIRASLVSAGGRLPKTLLGAILNLEGDAFRKALKRAEEAKAIRIEADQVILIPNLDALTGQTPDIPPLIECGGVCPVGQRVDSHA